MKSGNGTIAVLMILTTLVLQGCAQKQPPPAVTPPASDAAAPAASPAAVGGDVAAATATVAAGAGASTYQMYCQTCHGAGGAGDGLAAKGMNPAPASFAANAFRLDANGNGTPGEVADIEAIVRDGAAKYGGSPLMAPWPMLNAEQLAALARHVKSFSGVQE